LNGQNKSGKTLMSKSSEIDQVGDLGAGEVSLARHWKKSGIRKLMLEKPEIEKYVVVPFTVQDADSSRKDNDSVRRLQRVLRKTLMGSNWRLMSEGVTYRLGYLSGRLKGYEREEDLVELVRKEKRK